MGLRADARAFIGDELYLSAEVLANLSDAEIQDFVEELWTGGWEGFARDNGYRVNSEQEENYIVQLSRLQDLLGRTFRLGVLDEIVALRVGEDQIKLVTRCYETEEYRSRIRVTAKGTRLYAWERKNGRWKPVENSPFTSWDANFEPFEVVGQYGKVVTADIAAMIKWQDENCHRPGTPKTPMDGPHRKE